MPALLFVALLELVTWSASRDVSDKDLDDFLEEMEHRPKNEREDMVAAMDAHQQPKATERVKVVDERKEMEKLKTITDMRIVGFSPSTFTVSCRASTTLLSPRR